MGIFPSREFDLDTSFEPPPAAPPLLGGPDDGAQTWAGEKQLVENADDYDDDVAATHLGAEVVFRKRSFLYSRSSALFRRARDDTAMPATPKKLPRRRSKSEPVRGDVKVDDSKDDAALKH